MIDGDVGEHAEQPVGHQHEDDDHDGADIGRKLALLDRVLAEARTDRALLDHRQRRRQRAGAQQDRQIVGGLHGEIAGDLALPAGDRLADHGRGDHLVVEHDGKGLPDILGGGLREFARAGGIELEIDHGLAGSAGRSRSAHRVRSPPETSTCFLMTYGTGGLDVLINKFVVGRQAAALRLIRRHGAVHHAEFHLGGLAEDFLQMGRVLQTRHLHQDAIVALALDQRLDGAELVDAALDDLDRLLDGLAEAIDRSLAPVWSAGSGRRRHRSHRDRAAMCRRAARRAAATDRAVSTAHSPDRVSLVMRTSTASPFTASGGCTGSWRRAASAARPRGSG